MEITFENATLTGYKVSTKKEDLLCHSTVTIKTIEDGAPELLKEFKNTRSLSNLNEVANMEGWNKLCLPVDELIDIVFDQASFSGKLKELSVKRNQKKLKNTYTFTIEMDTDESEINTIVIPYLNARQEEELDMTNPANMMKKPKVVPIKYTCTFKN